MCSTYDDVFDYEGTLDGWTDLPTRAKQANTVDELLCCNQLDVTIKRNGRIREKRNAYLNKQTTNSFGCHSFTSNSGDLLTVGPYGWTFNGKDRVLVICVFLRSKFIGVSFLLMIASVENIVLGTYKSQ